MRRIAILLICICLVLAILTEAQASEILLVNKDNRLSSKYKPAKLVKIQGIYVASEVYNPLKQLLKAAEKDNVRIILVSGYRSYQHQAQLFRRKVQLLSRFYCSREAVQRAAREVAPPGASEHQTGLAIDVCDPAFRKLELEFKNTKAGKWISKNAWKYGFIIRYPKGKEKITKITYEPWHLRYVGLPHSIEIYKRNLTLEEYIEVIKGKDKQGN